MAPSHEQDMQMEDAPITAPSPIPEKPTLPIRKKPNTTPSSAQSPKPLAITSRGRQSALSTSPFLAIPLASSAPATVTSTAALDASSFAAARPLTSPNQEADVNNTEHFRFYDVLSGRPVTPLSAAEKAANCCQTSKENRDPERAKAARGKAWNSFQRTEMKSADGLVRHKIRVKRKRQKATTRVAKINKLITTSASSVRARRKRNDGGKQGEKDEAEGSMCPVTRFQTAETVASGRLPRYQSGTAWISISFAFEALTPLQL